MHLSAPLGLTFSDFFESRQMTAYQFCQTNDAMARPQTFGRDRGLQFRMILTLFLLGLVYAVLVGALFAAGAGAVTIALVAGLLFLLQFLTSDKIALASMGARQVGPGDSQDARRLHAIIERLCVQANLPKPRVAIAQTQMPNAFAVGRSPKTATVCATTGILALLNDGELEAVLGHELTHIQNRDVMVMTLASFFASIAAFLTQFGFFFGGGFGGGRDNQNNQGGFIFVILISAAVYVISWLLLQALSRYREFAADRGSAIITGRPSALISALYRIEGGMQRTPQRDLRAASGELAAFYIMPPRARQTITTLFSTHPPLEARVARLERLEAQLQGTA
jgi:heat shock protein HtpX